MKKLFIIIIIFISFQTLSKANDIRDFQIEGMSIGDSLLDFMTIKEIKKNIRNYVPATSKYYITSFNELKNYESLDIYLKRKDKNYIIKSIIGFVFLDFKKCKIKMNIVSKEIDQLFASAKKVDAGIIEHQYDKTGNSKEYQIAYLLNKDYTDDHVRIQCTDWSSKITKEKNWGDSFNVGAYNKEILRWFSNGYN
ncbi:hypothetical protein [Candidatus Pelagibacter sp. Uisw_127]|uniref:hypothetical protein n=1 Tax=Candidatus Pelagibacter sp. Uisw_127 TaxID=3230988 RepID=UPI0039EA8938